MTRDQVLAHVAFMAQWDEAYATRALKWYHANLPWMGLIASAAEVLPALGPPGDLCLRVKVSAKSR